MKYLKKLGSALLPLIALTITLTSCDDNKSYADRLVDETKSVNLYLSNHKVVNEIPADSIFEEGTDAPFYRLDPEGNIYMQVIRSGDRKKNKAEDDQLIIFRFTRYNLNYFYNSGIMAGEGNSTNMDYTATSFRYNNTTLASSTQYGTGIQMPLHYLGIDCEVNLVVKSQYGFTSEIANVTPYVYNLRYFIPLSN